MSEQVDNKPVKRTSSKSKPAGSIRHQEKGSSSPRIETEEKERKLNEGEREKDPPSPLPPLPDLLSSAQAEMSSIASQQKKLESIFEQLKAYSEIKASASSHSEKKQRAQAVLKEEIVALKAEKEILTRKVIAIGDVVSLNVGGQIYWTSRTTLTKFKGTMLHAMFSGRHRIFKDMDGHFFLDRNGVLFGYILDFLRNGKLPALPLEKFQALRIEADFFALNSLVQLIDERLSHMTSRQFAVLRYNENSNYNNLSWQGITQPIPLTIGNGSLYKSIDQVLAEVDQVGWELQHMSGDGSAEGGWMYVFRRKYTTIIEDSSFVLQQESGSSSGSPRGVSPIVPSDSSHDTVPRPSPIAKSTGILVERPLRKKHSGSF